MSEYFPVLGGHDGCVKRVPTIELNEDHALAIHSQTLTQLARRGGLDPVELVVNIEKRPFQDLYEINLQDAIKKINEISLRDCQ